MNGPLNNETPNDDDMSLETSETETSGILTAPIPDSYGSTPVKVNSDDQFYVPFCGLVFYIMAFLGFVCRMYIRETLTVAIVDMVNQSTFTEMDTAMASGDDEPECPADPEVENERGEFNWDRLQETAVLSAFYWGYEITQVCSAKI